MENNDRVFESGSEKKPVKITFRREDGTTLIPPTDEMTIYLSKELAEKYYSLLGSVLKELDYLEKKKRKP